MSKFQVPIISCRAAPSPALARSNAREYADVTRSALAISSRSLRVRSASSFAHSRSADLSSQRKYNSYESPYQIVGRDWRTLHSLVLCLCSLSVPVWIVRNARDQSRRAAPACILRINQHGIWWQHISRMDLTLLLGMGEVTSHHCFPEQEPAPRVKARKGRTWKRTCWKKMKASSSLSGSSSSSSK